ncbi:hypothetical protein A0128_07990 [Leptospira tipperaryensis]|uniref:Uncharacterized protein n=1 Tax=Leptospira tipperaryensis TaxID=2564040 RepID=A0A1D7UW08_9LEPT|nr:hypothetical protein A0128_07990 [Leptospira tipperaryensis]
MIADFVPGKEFGSYFFSRESPFFANLQFATRIVRQCPNVDTFSISPSNTDEAADRKEIVFDSNGSRIVKRNPKFQSE